MKNKSNDNSIYIIFFIIGLALICLGVFWMLRASHFVETTGTYIYTYESRSRDSDGYSINYYWYYEFYVNGEKYIAKTSGGKMKYSPSSNEDRILYNPNNPNENMIGSENTQYILIVVGIIFGSVPIFEWHKKKTVIGIETAQNNDRKWLWYAVLFLCGILLIILLSVNFDIKAIFTYMLFPTLFVLLFLFVIIKLLKIEKDKENNLASSSDYNDMNQQDDPENIVISEEQKEEVMKTVNKVRGIIGIIVGISWCGLILLPVLISILFVLLSLTNENPSYEVNGVEVTAWQFIASSIFDPFILIILLIGVLVLIKGIVDYKKSKK